MADQPTDPSFGPATIRGVPITVMAQYLKDLSFESPGAPATIGVATELREGSVNVDVKVVPLSGPNYEVVLRVRVEANHENKVIYLLEMEYGGLVQIGDVAAETVEPILMIEGPRLLFPYARSIVTSMTRDGGFAPLLINPIDFAAMYRDFKRKNREAAAAATANRP
ncbi:MAG TPA: protein-export chaperone SecB [Candidatus Acidoferrum sp.]|nr:protein-export chaperone SecB [Candidatus Acidoferrum sp.]